METMALTGLLGFLRPQSSEQRPGVIKLTEKELENIREQKRLVEDAAKVQRMLYVSLQLAMKSLAQKYKVSEESSIDFETGELIVPENADG